jgi:GT2 family glycosyltransferase
MEPPYRPRFVMIGVNYQTDDLALRFVRDATAASRDASMQIVLVDNSERHSSEKLFDLIHAENPDVLCVKPPRNLGYFGGASLGFDAFSNTRQDYDWVIVSNVDVEFHSQEFFAYLGRMGSMEDVGVVAPSIMSGLSHHDQNPFMLQRPTRAKMEFYRLLYRSYYLLNTYALLSAIYRQIRHRLPGRLLGWGQAGTWSQEGGLETGPTLPGDPGTSIYAPHGACVIFSNRFFYNGGSLDFPVFLFGEEICIAETVRGLDLRVIYDPNLVLTHHEHQSPQWRGVLLSRKAAHHLEKSTAYLVERYFR